MLSSEILKFLNALKKNNNRDWFHANKDWYHQVRSEFEVFIALLIQEIGKFDPDVKNLRPGDCIFRISRDIRFSHDKTPYKTNFGAYLSRGGKKLEFAGYYFHLEPGDCFLAGGIYLPSSPVLKRIREEIYHNTDEFLQIVNAPVFRRCFPEVYGERLKTAPAGYPRDWEHIEWLRLKSFTLLSSISPKEFKKPDFLKNICKVYKLMYPFNAYLNRAIENL